MLINRVELKRALEVRANVRAIPFREFVNLEWSTMIDCARLTNTQFSYPRITSRLISAAGWTPLKPVEKRGDAITSDRLHTEIKVSILSDNKFNFVQVRPNEKIDFYSLFGIYDDNSVKMFVLTHDEMMNEVAMLGGNAHSDGSEKRMSLLADGKNADYSRWLYTYAVDSDAFAEKPSRATATAISEAIATRLSNVKAVPRPCFTSIFDD